MAKKFEEGRKYLIKYSGEAYVVRYIGTSVGYYLFDLFDRRILYGRIGLVHKLNTQGDLSIDELPRHMVFNKGKGFILKSIT